MQAGADQGKISFIIYLWFDEQVAARNLGQNLLDIRYVTVDAFYGIV